MAREIPSASGSEAYAGPTAEAIATAIADETLTVASQSAAPRRAIDLFEQPVFVKSYSKLSGMWTYGIPENVW